jgi:hypothetical protein
VAVHPDASTALHAVRDLRARLQDALDDRHPPESCEAAARILTDLLELAELTKWCRDAGVAYARLDDTCGWTRLGESVGVPFQTLQGWRDNWYKREAEA